MTHPQPRGRPAALSRSLLRRARSEERSGGGGRNAQATSSRSRTFLDSPRQFTLENHRLPLALPQSFSKLRNSHVSLRPLSNRLIATRNTKTLCCCEEAVEDVSSLWKSEENRELISRIPHFWVPLEEPGAPLLASFARSGTALSRDTLRAKSAKTKTQQQAKLPSAVLVQTYAAKKILETGITMQAVQHQVRF
jgi:hypothetical protein